MIARVEASYGVHYVRVAPIGTRFECNVRPRLPVTTTITIRFDGLHALNAEAMEAWQAAHAPTHELDRRHYRLTSLGDLMTALNADLFMTLARDASADQLIGFANDRGGTLLGEIRGALDRGAPAAPLVARATRFAAVLGIRDASEALEAIAGLHPIEHLMALEHAVVSWMRATAEPPANELAHLARFLPSDTRSAGTSMHWYDWWWKVARLCTREDLLAMVDASIAFARSECRVGTTREVGRAALDEAARLAVVARTAPRAAMWAGRVISIAIVEIPRDENDAHYAAYMALTHCAHSIAAALRDDMDPPDANRHAAELLAKRALELLR